MNTDVPAYGLWPLALINAGVFIIFAFSFARPRTGRDWRSFGAFSAFIVALFGGFLLLAGAWNVLYKAQRTHTLATAGPYAYLRHPQYAGFIFIMIGFLLQWPTVFTLLMFPILIVMYVRLAHREEREVQAEFGEEYAHYAAKTPAFFPRLRRKPAEA